MTTIASDLTAFAVDIETITEDPANVREHSEKSIEAIKSSLARFGQQKLIVLRADGRSVLAGNGTLRAAKALGWEKIAAVKTTLKGSDAVAYGIADNRTTELSDWDYASLSATVGALIEDGFDVDVLGFDEDVLGNFMNTDWAAPEREALDPDIDNKTRLTFLEEEWDIIKPLIDGVRESQNDPKLTDSFCVTYLCENNR